MAVKYLDSTGLGYVWSKFKAWCNATFAAITHSHTGSQVVLTGYSKPANVSSIGTTDTTNQAIGKLEAKIDAIDTGQFGSAIGKDAVDCNTLIAHGTYCCRNCTPALHYPRNGNFFVEVLQNNSQINQRASAFNGADIYKRISLDNGVTWDAWVPLYNFGHGDKYIFVAKDGSDTNSGLSNADPVLNPAKAVEIAMGLKCSGAIYICFGPGEWGDIWIRPNDFNACALGFTNYSNSGVTTITNFEALTDSSARGNQPPHFSNIYVDFGGNFILGNISVDYIMVESGFLRSWQAFSFACIRAFNSKVNFSSHIVHKNENLHDGVLIIEHCVLVIGKADNKFVDTPTLYAYIVSVINNGVYIEPGTTWTGTFNGKKYDFSLGYTCVQSLSMPPEQWPGTTGNDGVHSYNGITYAKNVVAKGTIPVISSMSDVAIRGTAPSTHQQLYQVFQDANGINFSGIVHNYYTSRKSDLSLICHKGITNNYDDAVILALGYDENGNWYTYAPTPASNCNSYYIANAEFVRVHHSSGSDKRIKQDFANVSEDLLDAWDSISWQQYRLINEVNESGDDAPTRFGIVVQDVQKLLKDNNIDPDQYGFMYHLKYQGTDGDEPTEDNPEITKADKWYLNYNEALSIEAAYQRRKNKILERRISELEIQVENMLQVLESLKGA